MSYVAVSYSELKINLLIMLFGTIEIKTKQNSFTCFMIAIFKNKSNLNNLTTLLKQQTKINLKHMI